MERRGRGTMRAGKDSEREVEGGGGGGVSGGCQVMREASRIISGSHASRKDIFR